MSTITAPAEIARPRLHWWKEVFYTLAFYAVYSVIRNQFGSASVSPETAFSHAEIVIRIEQAIGLFHEETIQELFLSWTWFIKFFNIYYGTFHFIITGGALIWLYRHHPARYPAWRNTLGFTTALALIGFATFPLMPPRLLNDTGPFGGAAFAEKDYGFVDTLDEVGGWLSFDDEQVKTVSNQYAAMPSLHCAWATWSTCVLLQLLRRRWLRAIAIAYPFITLFDIMVTANHYWIDAAAGLVLLVIGWYLGKRLAAWIPPWHERAAAPSA
jgi:hypothetical protein